MEPGFSLTHCAALGESLKLFWACFLICEVGTKIALLSHVTTIRQDNLQAYSMGLS